MNRDELDDQAEDLYQRQKKSKESIIQMGDQDSRTKGQPIG
jgi:hypothetical protein